jgi:hypothetical protein
MKKVFFGLLIIAAGAGIFLYLRQQKKQSTIEQSLIIGDWKLDSLAFKKDSGGLQPNVLLFLDSNLLKYHYEFTKNNSILISLQDSLTSDSTRYYWAAKNELVWKDDPSAAGDSLLVTILSKDSLVLLGRDSTAFYFTKNK